MTVKTRPAADELEGGVATQARHALQRAVEHLLSLQAEQGWWQGELETNVTMDAEDLMMREFLGVRTTEQTERSARWIRSQQRTDGSWSTFPGGPPDLSTTVEAYTALRLAGDNADAAHLTRAREVVIELGGIERTRVFTRFWLALFGLWPWDRLPAVPVELILLPRWVPLNIYDFACWARQTIVPISILSSLRPRRPLGVTIDELRAPTRPGRPTTPALDPDPDPARSRRRRLFTTVDRVLHRAERVPWKPLRARALDAATTWVLDRQEADGSWGGIQPPWVYSLMALSALGYPVEHPVLSRGLDGLERFTIEQDRAGGVVRRVEACQSPVWDTALTLVALADAGLDITHPAVRLGVDWMVEQEIRTRGDWSIARPHLPAGGWAFEFDNVHYPDIDDTAEIVLGLDRVGAGGAAELAARRGVAWTIGMQCRDGGWAAFDADNNRQLAYDLPFCDFGAVIDPPSADVTAHVVEMLASRSLGGDPAAQRGVAWLLEHQEQDGSWFGRWGCNYVYGTGAVVPALVAAGIPPDAVAIRRAVRWLEDHQNTDGGWGEDLRSYTDSAYAGHGPSTPSQTAWALLALIASGDVGGLAAHRGAAWLAKTQRADGGWDEPTFTGTGFPGAFYIGYHHYRLVFPISALARFLSSRP